MRLPFLDRVEEAGRLRRALDHPDGSLVCLYGRRRCGKSRLLREVLGGRKAVYHVGDERTEPLQRRALAQAIAQILPGFAEVDYPDWDVLLDRWWLHAPAGAILALDEFPSLSAAVPSLPSLLQKRVDLNEGSGRHVVVSGSSQRMMQGLVLDSSSPLYGRCREVLKIEPLPPSVIGQAFRSRTPMEALEAWATWGGVPRYWELALDFPDRKEAFRQLVLDPMGVLHHEPARLLLDDLRETQRASSLLAVIGLGCRKISEMARRLEQPATSLARPLQRLVSLGLVKREQPFGTDPATSRQSLYSIGDPFLAGWYRFVDPNRSLLGAGQVTEVEAQVSRQLKDHLGGVWEELARSNVHRIEVAARRWRPAARWWGRGTDGLPLELDIVAESVDGRALLVGEVKLSLTAAGARRTHGDLMKKLPRVPFPLPRTVVPCLFYASSPVDIDVCAAVHAGELLPTG
jgi:AAA+ ATPase superfamily predicted ATPase